MRNKPRAKGGEWATRLKQARDVKGWTQDELATQSGVSRWTVMRWEQGSQEGKPDHLSAVADALGIPREEAFRAIGWLPPEDQDGPHTLEQRKAALLEALDPEDRAMLEDVFDLIELRKARRKQEDSPQAG